jgi:hypothetical protein
MIACMNRTVRISQQKQVLKKGGAKRCDCKREDLKKKKQGCKATDKVTHQTLGGDGTFGQVLDQATEN